MSVKRLFYNWPQKLGALLFAVLIWFFVSTDESTITQRSMLVPLTVDGLSSNQLTVGVPEVIEVTVSGPSARINNLKQANIEAILDLEGVSDEFEQPVRVIPPQDITLLRVNPSEIIGFVETEVAQKIPVTVALVGPFTQNVSTTASATPAQVTVTGRAEAVAKVTAALATVRADQQEVQTQIFAIGELGQPVASVRLEPNKVTVRLASEPILHTATVGLELVLPNFAPLRVQNVTLSQETLRVAGSTDTLAELESVVGYVEPDTRGLRPGEYTWRLRLELPESVYALESPSVTLELAAATSEDSSEDNSDEGPDTQSE